MAGLGDGDRGRAFTTSRQVTAPFLCHDCEPRFSDRGARHLLGQCARPDGFRLREVPRAACALSCAAGPARLPPPLA